MEYIKIIYLVGLMFFLVLYTAFAVKERRGFNFSPEDVGDIVFTSIFWFISFPFVVGKNYRVVEKK